MKKLFVFFAAVFMGTSLYAQSLIDGLSAGLTALFTVGLGTECEDSLLKSNISKAESIGFDSKDKIVLNWGCNGFVRYNFPFYKPVGVELDLAYFNQNGFIKELSNASGEIQYKYSYKSLELSPLVTYDLNYGILNFTFAAGPDFSFPVGKVDYDYSFKSSSSDSFDLKTKCTVGLTGGASIGAKFRLFEVFLSARYVMDFSTVEYSIGNRESELLTRRSLVTGLGARYIF